MFKKITDAVTDQIEEIGSSIKEAIKQHQQGIDTEQFNDPIANQTDWGPLISGGTNVRTHSLKKDMRGNLQFKVTIGTILFCSVFILIGLGAFVATGFVVLERGMQPEVVFISLFGFVFSGCGLWALRSMTAPVVFSFQKGCFYKGRLRAHESPRQKNLSWCALEEIHALQIVSERIRSKNSSYYSHELNIIKKDASRLNVVDHGNINKLRQDATTLANALDVPLWDASKEGFRLFG